nr:Zn-dependent hydrolase [Burkholderiaceae bacterium]
MNTLDSRALGLQIQPGPLLEQLNTLADIGMTPEGACCRLALSDEDRIGRDLLITWMKALKLEVSIDPIGNIFGWRAGLEDLPPVMTG